MRRTAVFRISVTAITAALISGCSVDSIGVVDVYDDAYLLELQQALTESDLVSHTDIAPQFYERAQNIPPIVAEVILEPAADIASVAPLIAAVTEVSVSHDEDVPALEFTANDDDLTSLGFSGRLSADDADAVVDHVVNSGWSAAEVSVPTGGEPFLRIQATIDTMADADALVSASNAPLPAPLTGAQIHQWVQVAEARFVRDIRVSGMPISAEFISTLAEIDALPHPVRSDLAQPQLSISSALRLGTGEYIMNARVAASPEQYRGLEADERRELARADGYTAFCAEVDRLMQLVPEMPISGTDCRVGGSTIEY